MENMAAIIQNLSGNPLATPIGQKIEQATDSSLPAEDWNLNMLICDMINDTDEGPKDAVRAIKRLLQQNAGKNHTTIMYTLTVLETCTKNCGRRFHLLVTSKDFVNELVKLIGPKNQPPDFLQTKVLSIIQTWATAFRGQPDLSGVVNVYTDLKSKSIEFPPLNYECQVPIHTPQRSVKYTQQPSSNHIPLYQRGAINQASPTLQQQQLPFNQHNTTRMAGPILLNDEQLAKLKSELEIVNGNIKVFDEMLTEFDKSNGLQSGDLELLTELNGTCLQMQKRIVELLDKVSNEEVTSELLTINDNLNALFSRYEVYLVKNQQQNPQQPQLSIQQQRPTNISPIVTNPPTATSVKPKVNQGEASLIDLGETKENNLANQLEVLSIKGAVGGEQQANKQLMNLDKTDQTKNRAQPNVGDTDFDEFAQLRSEKSLSNKNVQDQDEGIPNEQEVDEMMNWLKEQNSTEQPASLSNTDFDKFLEQRFSNLEKNQPPKKPDTSKNSGDLLDL